MSQRAKRKSSASKSSSNKRTRKPNAENACDRPDHHDHDWRPENDHILLKIEKKDTSQYQKEIELAERYYQCGWTRNLNEFPDFCDEPAHVKFTMAVKVDDEDGKGTDNYWCRELDEKGYELYKTLLKEHQDREYRKNQTELLREISMSLKHLVQGVGRVDTLRVLGEVSAAAVSQPSSNELKTV